MDDVLNDLSEKGVAELYSVPRVAEVARDMGLQQGWSLDKVTGWDFDQANVRRKARELMDRTRPRLLVGSPMCTFFSTLMNWNWSRMSPERAQTAWDNAVMHLEFATEMYRAQMDAGRLFVHEHPAAASSWKLPCMQALLTDPGVRKPIAHQCE